MGTAKGFGKTAPGMAPRLPYPYLRPSAYNGRPPQVRTEGEIAAMVRLRAWGLGVVCLAIMVLGAQVSWADDPPTASAPSVTKPIDVMIKAIRYGKFEFAGRSLDYTGMCEGLLQETWKAMSAEQRQSFQDGFQYLMENTAFPKAKDKFEYLDDISYGEPKVTGSLARVSSTIVIFHDLKKEEIAVEYVLAKLEDRWRIRDVILEEESTIESIREDQIEELLDEGGVDHLLKILNERVAEVRAERAESK